MQPECNRNATGDRLHFFVSFFDIFALFEQISALLSIMDKNVTDATDATAYLHEKEKI